MGTNYQYPLDGRPDGAQLGAAATEKMGFYGATPVDQPADAQQAVVASSTTTTATTVNLQSSIDALVSAHNAVRNALVSLGLIKGAA